MMPMAGEKFGHGDGHMMHTTPHHHVNGHGDGHMMHPSPPHHVNTSTRHHVTPQHLPTWISFLYPSNSLQLAPFPRHGLEARGEHFSCSNRKHLNTPLRQSRTGRRPVRGWRQESVAIFDNTVSQVGRRQMPQGVRQGVAATGRSVEQESKRPADQEARRRP